jgi:LacI family transcriptional regulator
MAIKSVRDLARSLGVSHTTVSDALRNSPRVRAETRERVLKAAEAAGYRHNPLAGALMSEMRRAGVGKFRGVLAVVDLECETQREESARRFHAEVLEGAREAAGRLGFKVELFVLGRTRMSVARLGRVLETRGIRGVILLPAAGAPDVQDLDWEKFAGCYTDYIIEKPALDTICSDHFRSMVLALQKLRERGYRRPGLVLHEAQDARLLYRWEAAFREFQMHQRPFDAEKPLMIEQVNKELFVEWFRESRPDVVLCHRVEVLGWMRDLGAKVPETHGFCCLNVMMSPLPLAGLDLQPRLIGAKGVETVVSQMQRNGYGLPRNASTVTIPALWREGSTLRQNTCAVA